jgi:soluble lytic murein transglycosylase-like protein
MRSHRKTYVHRGDAERRARRLKRSILFGLFVCAVAIVARLRGPNEASAEASHNLFTTDAQLRKSLDSAIGELNIANAQLDRWKRVAQFSSRYSIGADLAGQIYDVALAEGIEPDLAFRLVKLESDFNPRAKSPVGAVGLTQLMLPTARFYDRGVTEQGLYEPHRNLRIGFRYLRGLIKENDGDVNTALLVYNRGPVAVNRARRNGENPSNGYDRILTRGLRGKGTVD